MAESIRLPRHDELDDDRQVIGPDVALDPPIGDADVARGQDEIASRFATGTVLKATSRNGRRCIVVT